MQIAFRAARAETALSPTLEEGDPALRAGEGKFAEPLPGARGQLGLAVLVITLVMSVWFSTAAVVPSLIASWGISSGDASWLTSAVQVGFVFGAVLSALLNLADRVPIGALIAGSALLAAATTALVPVLWPGPATAIPLRFATGVAIAGVYPTGTKLVASWFGRGRGLAMGVLLAALTLGSALPHLVTAFGNPAWRLVLFATAGLAALGAAFSPALRYGPRTPASAPLDVAYVLRMFTDRRQRYVNLGYFGHMWELYAFWTWLVAFLTAAFAAPGGWLGSPSAVSVLTFAAAGVAGALGCIWAGAMTAGRSPIALARVSLLVSGACCVLSPLAFGGPAWALTALILVWGVFVIADSPMFSTALSEVADRRYVGTALTAQMAIGFLITTVAIRLVPVLADAVGWRWAFSFLAAGPALGLWSMRRLARGEGDRPKAPAPRR